MNISALIDALGRHYGMPLALKPGEAMAIEFEEGTVFLEHDAQDDGLHLYLVVAEAPWEDSLKSGIYAWALEANLFGRWTDGCQLGLDAARGELVLSSRADLRYADPVALVHRLDAMLRTAFRCRQALATRADFVPASGSGDTFGSQAGAQIAFVAARA